MTDLFDNAFHVLKATPRTNRSTLVQLAEDASLSGDANRATEARATLGNPKSRLSAELAWFPGVSPARTTALLGEIGADPTQVYGDLGIPPLATSNAIAAALGLMRTDDSDDVLIACSDLAEAFLRVDAAEVRRDVNEDRQVAGVPLVADDAPVIDEIETRRRHYVGCMLSALDALPTHDLVDVATALASGATSEGEEPAGGLIDDLIEAYSLRVHAYLSGEAEGIKAIIEAAKEAADAGGDSAVIKQLVERIVARIRTWDLVAQPIQLSKQGKGLPHEESVELAMEARDLAVHLFNKHDYLDTARSISAMLQEVFAEVPDVLERVEEDIEALEDIFTERQARTKKDREDEIEFAREITYETTLGLVFKDRLRISPQGFEFKGQVTPLDEISSLSWGGVQSQYSTSYYVHLRTTRGGAIDVEMNDGQKYSEITKRLWRAAGVRLMVEFLSGLRGGKRYRFGNITVADDGVTLTVPKLFRADESAHVLWSQARRSTGNGAVTLTSADNTARGAFDLRGTPNGPIFAACIDMLWKKGGARMSAILGGER